MRFSKQGYQNGLSFLLQRSSWPRSWTQVSRIAGRVFIISKSWSVISWACLFAWWPEGGDIPRAVSYSTVQWLSHVQLSATPWIAARQASLSITNSQSPPKPMSIESVMPSSHLILCRPLLLLPPILPSIRVFSNESILRMRRPKYWSFSLSISPSNEHPGLTPSGWTGWISLQSKGLSRVFSNTRVQKHQFFSAQLSSPSNSHIHSWILEKP